MNQELEERFVEENFVDYPGWRWATFLGVGITSMGIIFDVVYCMEYRTFFIVRLGTRMVGSLIMPACATELPYGRW